MGSEYKASERARIDDVDLYNLTAIRKEERERNRACDGPWGEPVDCRKERR